MKFKSIVAAAGAVLLATAGAAQADEVLTPTGGGEVERFSALLGVTAHPMSIEESAAVRGAFGLPTVFWLVDSLTGGTFATRLSRAAASGVLVFLQELELPLGRTPDA